MTIKLHKEFTVNWTAFSSVIQTPINFNEIIRGFINDSLCESIPSSCTNTTIQFCTSVLFKFEQNNKEMSNTFRTNDLNWTQILKVDDHTGSELYVQAQERLACWVDSNCQRTVLYTSFYLKFRSATFELRLIATQLASSEDATLFLCKGWCNNVTHFRGSCIDSQHVSAVCEVMKSPSYIRINVTLSCMHVSSQF